MMNTKEAKRTYWARQVEEWKASGETQSNYCRQHDLKPHQLTYWVQVFKSKSPIERSAVSTKGFVALQVTSPHTPGLTIKLPNGLELEGVTTGNLAIVREIMGWPS